MDALSRFLRDYRTSRSREYLLTTRLIHDISVAAAASGYDLLTYLPTVDADGFDVILDDRDRLVPVQLKSIIMGGKAAHWKIHRKLLRPEPGEEDDYGFEPSPRGQGRAGGVILTWVAARGPEVTVRYSYTDIDVLTVLWLGLLPLARPQARRMNQVRVELESAIGGTIALPRSAFLSAKSPEHLLALAGLHSRVSSNWRSCLRALLREKYRRIPAGVPATTLAAQITQELSTLVGRPT